MAFRKVHYNDKETLITAKNMNDIQDAIIDIEKLTSGVVVVNEASGQLIHINDATKQGFMSFNVYGKTTQNGTPTHDAPVELVSAGNGGTLAVNVCCKNLLKITLATQTSKGITCTVNGDGSVVINGTATDDVFFHLGTVRCFANTKYRLSGGHSGGTNSTCYLYYKYGETANHYAKDYGNGTEFTPPSDIGNAAIITVVKGVTVSNLVFYPMITLASVTDAQYEPYKGQTLTVSMPNGLPGIPVTSGGNYTDANGQQWICDEIDFARGVYIQRINTISPQSAVKSYDNFAGTNRVVAVCTGAINSAGNVVGAVMCDSLPTISANDQYSTNTSSISNVYGSISVTIKDVKTEAAVIQWLMDNPIKIQYALETPIETPLPEEELAAYAALHTYRENTTVINDSGAYMELEYLMDAKKYIDRIVSSAAIAASAGIINATVE